MAEPVDCWSGRSRALPAHLGLRGRRKAASHVVVSDRCQQCDCKPGERRKKRRGLRTPPLQASRPKETALTAL